MDQISEPTPFPHRQPRSWLKLAVTTPAALTDTVAGFVAELTGSGVEIAPAASPTDEAEIVIGYLDNDLERPAREAALLHFLEGLAAEDPARPAPTLATSLISEEDWGRSWKRHFKPFHITPRIVIKPSWEDYDAETGCIVVEMDPGMAFGTGHHASTSLALNLIEGCFAAGRSRPATVLDVGTGTGILGIACALLGSRRVTAIDNDADAVAAAEENIARNAVADRMTAGLTPLAELTGVFDLVAANITSDVLIAMAPLLAERTAAGGALVLAGILAGEQERAVEAAFRRLGLQAAEIRHQGEWAAFRFDKP